MKRTAISLVAIVGLLGLVASGCSSGYGRLSLEQREAFMIRNSLGVDSTTYDGYTEGEFNEEADDWCDRATYDEGNEYMADDGPEVFYYLVSVTCGAAKADEALEGASSSAEREEWAEAYQAELTDLDLK